MWEELQFGSKICSSEPSDHLFCEQDELWCQQSIQAVDDQNHQPRSEYNILSRYRQPLEMQAEGGWRIESVMLWRLSQQHGIRTVENKKYLCNIIYKSHATATLCPGYVYMPGYVPLWHSHFECHHICHLCIQSSAASNKSWFAGIKILSENI